MKKEKNRLDIIKKNINSFNLANMISSYAFIYLSENCRLCPLHKECKKKNLMLKYNVESYMKNVEEKTLNILPKNHKGNIKTEIKINDIKDLILNGFIDRNIHYCFIKIYNYFKDKNKFNEYIEKLSKNDIIKLVFSLQDNYFISDNCENIDNKEFECPIYKYCNKQSCNCKENINNFLNELSNTQKKNRNSK